MSLIGKSVGRLDAVDKVVGKAEFACDIDLPGMWHGAVVSTQIPHGRLGSVVLDPAFDWSQVATADAADVPGKNCVAMIEEDLPLIVTDRVMHVGEAVLLIAAPTRELAKEAARHVKVECEALPPVLTMDESKGILSQFEMTKGDAKAVMARADVVVEGTYETGHQEHIYIETQGMVATWEKAGGLSVVGSLQCPFYVSRALAILMGVPEGRISVRQSAVGGAFGGKEDYPSILAGFCAVLSRKCGHPVKIVYDRDEDIRVTTKRHPARVRHRTGVSKDGKLVAMEILYELDAGAYVTLTPVVLSRGLIHSAGSYRCSDVYARAVAYATNTPPNGAFRGFGAPQAFFPLEVHMDRVAAELRISPLEFRRKNCLVEGDSTATGQVLTESVAGMKVIEEAVRISGFEERRADIAKGRGSSNLRRGIGMSLFMHGAGFTGSGERTLKSRASLRLTPEGRIEILTSCVEMGQGAHTVLPQMVAEFLGVEIGLVSVPPPDTARVPNGGPTVASRTTMIMGDILQRCAAKISERLSAFAEERYGGRCSVPVNVIMKEYAAKEGELVVTEEYRPPPNVSWDEETHRGDAYPVYSWGCDVAEVEVDMDTLECRVVKMWLAQDVGRAINPVQVEGQIEGGTLQSLGWAVMEREVMASGSVRSDRLQTYMIPTSVDAPEMVTSIVEEPYPRGPAGAKGVGELPMNGGAPAIANAIYDATGIRVCSLPITPEKLYEEWKRMKDDK